MIQDYLEGLVKGRRTLSGDLYGNKTKLMNRQVNEYMIATRTRKKLMFMTV